MKPLCEIGAGNDAPDSRQYSPSDFIMKAKSTAFLVGVAIYLLTVAQSQAVGGAVETLRDMQNATSPDHNSARIYVERALAKERAGDFPGAMVDYSAAIAIKPESGAAHYDRGLLYAAMARFNEAIADFDVALKALPNDADIYLNRAAAHAKAHHPKEALADYDGAIRNAPNSTEGVMIRAKASAEKRDFAKAAAWYDEARRRSPRNDRAQNGFAWFKVTCPDAAFRNGPEAVKAATKACELTKWKDSSPIDTLAAAYAELGNFNQATKFQMQALAIRPDSLSQMQKHLRAYQARKPFREEPKLRKS
jgi:tetratricopeptide (TPR) repeat protein